MFFRQQFDLRLKQLAATPQIRTIITAVMPGAYYNHTIITHWSE
jgi:hypothetical protein